MFVVADGGHQFVHVRVQVLAVHAFVMAAGDDVPEMIDDAIGDEHLAMLIEVEAPGIRRAVRHHLELFLGRMITPDAAVDRNALLLRRAGSADVRGGDDAVAAVEPAVGAPGEAVEDVVPGFERPAIEHDLGRAGGQSSRHTPCAVFLRRRNILCIVTRRGNGTRSVPTTLLLGRLLDRNEDEVRRRARPDAAEAVVDAGEVLDVVGEDGAFVVHAVAVGVFEDDDAILARFRIGLPVGIRVALRDPDSPAIVEAKRDRLHDIGLAGEEGRLEAGRQRHFLRGDASGQRLVLGEGGGGE